MSRPRATRAKRRQAERASRRPERIEHYDFQESDLVPPGYWEKVRKYIERLPILKHEGPTPDPFI